MNWELEKALYLDEMKIDAPYSGSQDVWLAEVIGPHPKFKFDRVFKEPDNVDRGYKEFKLDEGVVYHYCPSTRSKERVYFMIKDGKVTEFTEHKLKEYFGM